MTNEFVIRSGVPDDLARVLELVHELAVFEREPDAVVTTVAQMEIDGFGPHPVFGFFVAETGDEIIGISLYYWRYSTWKGKRLYLEDLIVTESARGSGAGTALFERTMQHALDEQCSGMVWQVLDWNEPAIRFYEGFGAALDGGWLNCSLEREQLAEIVEKPTKKT